MVWHKQHGFKENPLDYRNLSKKVIGENNQIEKLKGLIEDGKIGLLYGITGTGKSTIIQHLIKDLNCRCIRINCDLIAGKQGLDFKKDFLKKSLLYYFSKKKIVVFLDEMNASPKYLIQQIKGLSDEKEIHSVVGVQISKEMKNCPESFKERIVNKEAYIETRKLKENELMEMFEERLEGKELFEKKALESIILKGKYNPRKCLEIAHEVCKKAKKFPIKLKDVSKVNIEEEETQTKIVEKVERNVTSQRFKELSPFQKDIVNLLLLDGHSGNELAKKLDKAYNSITKQTSLLVKKGLVKTTGNRPKKYNLIDEFKRELLKD